MLRISTSKWVLLKTFDASFLVKKEKGRKDEKMQKKLKYMLLYRNL